MRNLAAAALLALVIIPGCAQRTRVSAEPEYSQIKPATNAQDSAPSDYAAVHGHAPPAMPPVAPLPPIEDGALIRARAEQATAERNARAQCVYQAQVANMTTPGLVSGLFAGLGVGNACIDYYKNIGVIRD